MLLVPEPGKGGELVEQVSNPSTRKLIVAASEQD